MSDEKFESLVSDAIDNLPGENIDHLDNVAIVVEDWPTPLQLQKGEVTRGTLFGLYEGVPKPRRGAGYNLVNPDKITIFKGPLTRAAVNEDHLKHLVNNTVWHEVAHHYGLGHGRIHQLERKAQVKKQFSGDPEYETSGNLSEHGIRHGWFGRSGGVSLPPFESLNTSFSSHDRPEFVEENLRRALFELGMDRARLVSIGQVHGSKVLKATAKHAGKVLNGYDAIVTDVVDLPIAVNNADCVPLFIYDPKHRAVGVVHAGWRGLQAGVIDSTIKAMEQELGSNPRSLVAAIGPSAGPESYAVSQEIANSFAGKFSKKRASDILLDLPAIARHKLAGANVNKVEDSQIDTITNKKFFSYRRDNITGRNFNVISL